jgi:hypothetical protein
MTRRTGRRHPAVIRTSTWVGLKGPLDGREIECPGDAEELLLPSILRCRPPLSFSKRWHRMKVVANTTAAIAGIMMLTTFAVALAGNRGRSWTTAALVVGSTHRTGDGCLLRNRDGEPMVIADAIIEATANRGSQTYHWRDSAWVAGALDVTPDAGSPMPGINLEERPCFARLVMDSTNRPSGLLLTCTVDEFGAFHCDTALRTTLQGSEFGMAATRKRTWVVRSEQRPQPSTRFRIVVAYSETSGVWHRLQELGTDDFMCTIAPDGQSGAIVAFAAGAGLRWARTDGRTWQAKGVIDPRPSALHPRFGLDSAGTPWLAWTDKANAHVVRYVRGAWRDRDSVMSEPTPSETFWSTWCDLPRWFRGKPPLAWGDRGYASTHRDRIVVSTPTEHGWAPGRELPGSQGGFIPFLVIDRNDDLWALWSSGKELRFAHTYVTATVSDLDAARHGSTIGLSATLSEVTPGSWWSVARAGGDEPFKNVARIAAGPTRTLQWSDRNAPSGRLRYRIGRDCVDQRYVWWSPPVDAPALRADEP